MIFIRWNRDIKWEELKRLLKFHTNANIKNINIRKGECSKVFVSNNIYEIGSRYVRFSYMKDIPGPKGFMYRVIPEKPNCGFVLNKERDSLCLYSYCYIKKEEWEKQDFSNVIMLESWESRKPFCKVIEYDSDI